MIEFNDKQIEIIDAFREAGASIFVIEDGNITETTPGDVFELKNKLALYGDDVIYVSFSGKDGKEMEFDLT